MSGSNSVELIAVCVPFSDNTKLLLECCCGVAIVVLFVNGNSDAQTCAGTSSLFHVIHPVIFLIDQSAPCSWNAHVPFDICYIQRYPRQYHNMYI